jgi:hypothetical protein
MMHKCTHFRIFLVLVLFATCHQLATSDKKSSLDMDNYFAWCIVPFDSQNRTPAQRMEMLKTLGFQSYAYDWREKHLARNEG